MKINKFFLVLPLLFILAVTIGCDSDSEAQTVAIEFGSNFSGSFLTASVNTDTNNDGRPSFTRFYEGESDLGQITINITDEFAQPIPPVTCPEDNLEFMLVSGSFVMRVENGDLLLGVIESGVSCFDSVNRTSFITENGVFTDGTGEFVGITGAVEIRINSIFLNTTSVNGFASGGSTGFVSGNIIPK